MLILHENLDSEAEIVAKTLKDVYHIPVNVSSKNLEGLLVPNFNLNGYSGQSLEKLKEKYPEVNEKAALILTPRDLYWEDNENE